MAAAIPIAMVAGAGMQMYGQYKSSKAQQLQFEREAQLRDMQSLQAQKQAERDARLLQTRGQKIKGAQQAAFAAAGVQLKGTPLEIMEDTARQIEEERLSVLEGGGFKASQLGESAATSRMRQREASRALPFQIGGTLLTSSAQAAKASGAF